MNKPALILIDIQKGFDDVSYWGEERNNPEAEYNASRLLNYWREKSLPVFHVKHNSTNPKSLLAKGKPGNEIQDIVKPLENEPVIEKEVNSAFIGTDLHERLLMNNIETVVIAGFTTEHCVSTSVRMAGNLGFKTFVLSDATAAFSKIGFDGKKYTAANIHETALASLHEEFATVLNTEQLLKSYF